MKHIITKTIVFLLLATTGFSQLGAIDPNFNIGTGFGPDQWTGRCEAIIQQPDGKLIVGGQFTEFDGTVTPYLVRLNLDGTIDVNFTNQFQQSWGYNITAIGLQNDGKIIIGGTFSEINGVSRNGIARLNNDGSLDLTFDPASGFNQEVTAVEVQSDGKILVGGLFTIYDYQSGGLQIQANGLARLNADGSFDNTLNIGSGFTGSTGIGQRQIHKIKVQPDGKILVAGHYSGYNGSPSLLITRLNSDGSIDSSFDANPNFAPAVDGFYGQIYSLKVLSNGKIMIGGNYGNTNSLAFGVDRLNSDGSLDISFEITHSFSNIRNFAMDIQSDGKIIVANQNFGAPNEAYVVERYNTDGSLDTNFPQRYLNNEVKDLIIQMDGKITFVGYFDYNPTGIMRLIGDSPGTTGLNNHSIAQELNIWYPNPANNFISTTHLPIGSEITLFDNQGKVVYKTINSETSITIPSESFEDGFYVIEVRHKDILQTQKLAIAH